MKFLAISSDWTQSVALLSPDKCLAGVGWGVGGGGGKSRLKFLTLLSQGWFPWQPVLKIRLPRGFLKVTSLTWQKIPLLLSHLGNSKGFRSSVAGKRMKIKHIYFLLLITISHIRFTLILNGDVAVIRVLTYEFYVIYHIL